MATAGRDATPAPTASAIADALEDAEFVRLLACANGDALAATGVLAGALSTTGTPFQASIAAPFETDPRAVAAEYTLAVGAVDVAADAAVDDGVAASATAFEVAGELVASDAETATSGPDPILALAGTIAAGEVVPPVIEAAESAGVDRRPGLALPVRDLADGLAHSTLLCASFSGDPEAATAAIAPLSLPADLAEEDRRRLASLVALEVTSAPAAPERAAESIERALRPYVGGPFETAGGFADVLDAAARERPGVGLALALGHDGAHADALDAWRDHASAAHAALTDGDTERHDGLFVVRAPTMPVATVARLAAQFRSPEPVVLAVAEGEAAIDAVDDPDAATALHEAAEDLGGRATGTGASARAQFDTEENGTDDDRTATGDALVAAVLEAR